MKKIIVYGLTILLLFVTIGCKQKSVTTFDIKQIRSDLGIHFERTYEYAYSFGEPDQDSKFLSSMREYDKKGNKVRSESYYKDKKDDRILTYYYENSNCVETIAEDLNGNTTFSFVDNYDEKGNHISEESYDKDNVLYRKESYEYNNTGNPIKKIEYDRYGDVERTTEYTHNDSLRYYYPNGLSDSMETAKIYDKDGNFVEQSRVSKISDTLFEFIVFDKDNEIVMFMSDTVDEDKFLIRSEISFFDDGEEDKTIEEYFYDENHLLVKTIYYDKAGNPEKEEIIERETY